MKEKINNKTSEHILNTSSNLLGFCLFVITSFHISNYAQKSMVDECASIIAFTLICSSLFSFFAIRTKNETTERKLESLAEYLFALSLIGILVVILLLVFKFLH